MNDDFLILNIREYLKQEQDGEDLLRQSFSAFSCRKNIDAEEPRCLIQLLKVL